MKNNSIVFLISLRNIIFYCLNYFQLIKTKFGHSNYSKKILIIRSDGIGDFFIWFNIYLQFYCYFKNSYEVHILAGKDVCQFLIDSNLIDKCVEFNYKKFKEDPIYVRDLLAELNSAKFEIIINPLNSRTSFSDYFVSKINAKRKIANYGNTVNSNLIERFLTKFYYTDISYDFSGSNEHQSNKIFMHFIQKRLGIKLKKIPQNILNVNLNYRNINNNEIIKIVIMTGAGDRKRGWPKENFIELIKKLNNYNNMVQFILIGSSNEIIINKEIFDHLKKTEKINLIDCTNKMSLFETFNFLNNVKLVITNETSILHMSNFLNLNTVCIAGGGHYNRFVNLNNNPKCTSIISENNYCFNCDWRCIRIKEDMNKYPCITEIEINKVLSHCIKYITLK